MRTHRVFMWILSFIILGLGLGAGCGDNPNPVAPGSTVAGAWAGSITDAAAGAGTAELTIARAGDGLSGTWKTTVAGKQDGGSLSGTGSVSPFQIFLTPATPLVCSPTVTLSGTLAATMTLSDDRLVGSYLGFQCGGAATGSLSLDRK